MRFKELVGHSIACTLHQDARVLHSSYQFNSLINKMLNPSVWTVCHNSRPRHHAGR